METASWAGMPVVIRSWSDCEEIEPVLAVTRTAVLNTPAVTLVTTLPVAGSEVAEVGYTVSPPGAVLRLKSTRALPKGLPALSTTRKVTRAVSDRLVPPVPFMVIMGGDVTGLVTTDTNWIEPMDGELTGRLPVDVTPFISVAVMVSPGEGLLQPLSR